MTWLNMQSRIQAKPSNNKNNTGFSITIAVTVNIKHMDTPLLHSMFNYRQTLMRL
jgi:hypothetical protein